MAPRKTNGATRAARLGSALVMLALHEFALAQGGLPMTPSASGTIPIGVGGNPDARRYTLQPGIRARIESSDNPDRVPDADAQSGTTLEVTPYVIGTLNSPRGVGTLFYGLRGFIRDGGNNPRDEIRHDLRAWGDVKLAEDHFRLLARANVFDVTSSPFGSSSFDAATQTSNRTQYRDFEVAPYAFGRFDGEGRWTARYSLRYIDPGTSFRDSTVGQFSGFAISDLVRRKVGMSLSAIAYNVGYEGGVDYDGGSVDLLGWYRVDPRLRVGAGVGYSWNSILFDGDGNNSGFGSTVAAEWTPDARTRVLGRWSERYFGNVADLRASHRAERWTFGLLGFKGLQDGNRSGLYGVNTASLYTASGPDDAPTGSASNPVTQTLAAQELLGPTVASYGSGVINSPLVYVDSLVASIGWTGTRNSSVATVFVNNRRTAVPFTGVIARDVDQWGGTLAWRHRLTARNGVTATGRFTHSEDNLTGQQADLTGLWLTVDHRLTMRSVAALGGRVQRQRGSGATIEFDEAAVFATVDYRF